jgi:hypothetical protein
MLRAGFDPKVYEQIRALKIDPLCRSKMARGCRALIHFLKPANGFNAEYEVRRSLAVTTMSAAPFAS